MQHSRSIAILSSLLCSGMLLLPAFVSAQSVKITLPDSTSCTYATGQVTSNATPGQLQATATGTPQGTGCGGGPGTSAVTFGPAAPLSPALITLPGNTGTVPFTFQALNATQCIGSITGATGGAFTGSTTLCNGAGCNAPVSAPASFTNSSTTANAVYNVKVTCSGAGSPATSMATVTVPFNIPPPPSGCQNAPTLTSTTSGIPNFTQLTGNLPVFFFAASNPPATVDITSFDSIYWLKWPGNPTISADFTLPTSKYISAQFTVPHGYIAGYHGSNSLYGNYSVVQSNNSGAAISMTISTSCGDFSSPVSYPSSSVVPGCWKNKLGVGGTLQWRADTTCILHDDGIYFLNIINADISTLQPLGGGSAASTSGTHCSGSCSVPIGNNPGSWTTYTFP